VTEVIVDPGHGIGNLPISWMAFEKLLRAFEKLLRSFEKLLRSF